MEKNIKEEFISTLSHEIRTPLTSIKGFSQTMLSSWDKLDEDKKKEFLGIILNQSQRLIKLVENVLNVAKIDSNSQNILLSKVDLNKIIETCIKLEKIAYPNFEFKFNRISNELYSLCDNDKVQQIILNILENACKYSNNSNTVEIRSFIEKEYCVISIKNFGSFIKEQDFEKIFEKFYRADSYLNSTTQGSGLGLYIARNLAKKMNGNIKVKSNKEENLVEFLIFMPIYEIEEQTKKIGV